jgi:hypothetical protein
MSPQTERSLFWLPGPLLAGALVGLAIHNNVGPGAVLLCTFGAIGFMFVAPIIQLVLLMTPRFKGRYP